jgi:xylulokinase
VARAAFEGVVCGLLDGLDALAAQVDLRVDRLVLVGGGAHSPAYRRVLADLSNRVVLVPDHPEQVATGACVPPAAVLHGRPIETVQDAWGLDTGTITEPDPAVDRAAVRAAYREAAG